MRVERKSGFLKPSVTEKSGYINGLSESSALIQKENISFKIPM